MNIFLMMAAESTRTINQKNDCDSSNKVKLASKSNSIASDNKKIIRNVKKIAV